MPVGTHDGQDGLTSSEAEYIQDMHTLHRQRFRSRITLELGSGYRAL